MHDAVWIALISAIPPTIFAMGALVVSLLNHRRTGRVEAAAKEIHLTMNSRLDMLLDLTDKLAFARGEKSEIDKRIDRLAGDG